MEVYINKEDNLFQPVGIYAEEFENVNYIDNPNYSSPITDINPDPNDSPKNHEASLPDDSHITIGKPKENKDANPYVLKLHNDNIDYEILKEKMKNYVN